MDKPKKRWFYYIGGFFLVLAIPLTVYLIQQQQDIRQRAQEVVPSSITQETITYPWQYPRSGNNALPVVSTTTRSLVATIPFSARNCPKKSIGDADCNNMVDLSDVSYWQIDYEKGTAYYADFNDDGKVTLSDYNIWREHANIAAIPLVQKLSQKIGLEKLFASLRFQVFAQEAIPTVSDSTLVLSADIYRIINQYTDSSYSVQTNETGNVGGQITYYNSNGDQIAQANNYSQDTATLTTRVGSNVVSVAQNPDGLVGQTIQDANGAFKAAQFWPTTQAYARGDFPQAVTLPIAGGFSTVSLVPNVGAQVVSRNANGAITSYSTINGSVVATIDYINKSYVISDADRNSTLYTIDNNLGGQTTYLFNNLTVAAVKVTDSKENTFFIRPLGINQYQIFTVNSKKETTEQTVTDPMTTLGVDSPSPTAMTTTTQEYARTRNTTATSFTSGFVANGRIPAQLPAVNRLLAIQNAQPAVLGAKTSLLAQAQGQPADTPPGGSSAAPSADLGPGIFGDNQGNISVPPGLSNAFTPPTTYTSRPEYQHTPVMEFPATPGVSIYAPVQGPAVPRGGEGLPEEGQGRGTAPAPARAGGEGLPEEGQGRGTAPAPAAPGAAGEPDVPTVVTVPPTIAAARQTAEVSEAVSVTTSVTNPDGSTFSSGGTTSTFANAAAAAAGEGSLQGAISVTADHGLATGISIDGNNFTLGANGWEFSGSEPGAGDLNANTVAALEAQIQEQAAVTGVEQETTINVQASTGPTDNPIDFGEVASVAVSDLAAPAGDAQPAAASSGPTDNPVDFGPSLSEAPANEAVADTGGSQSIDSTVDNGSFG